VQIAAELDISQVVPLLRDGRFTNYQEELPATN
jgi:hypothetical protein